MRLSELRARLDALEAQFHAGTAGTLSFHLGHLIDPEIVIEDPRHTIMQGGRAAAHPIGQARTFNNMIVLTLDR